MLCIPPPPLILALANFSSVTFPPPSSISLLRRPVGVRGSRSAQRDPDQLHHQTADRAGEGVPLQQVPDAGAEGGGGRQPGAERDAGENLVPEPQDEAEETGEAGLRFGQQPCGRGEGVRPGQLPKGEGERTMTLKTKRERLNCADSAPRIPRGGKGKTLKIACGLW